MKELSETLHTPVEHCPDIQSWKSQRIFEQSVNAASTLKHAFLGGCRSDRIAWAFCSGYQWAIRSLVPDLLDSHDVLALCISESGGGHPRQIFTTLEPHKVHKDSYILSGEKTFITCGTEADQLLIAARTGEQEDGRPALRMVLCPSGVSGATVTTMPALLMVPELPHATIKLDQVIVSGSDVLSGDGYLQYIRPFRMQEDLHVQAALAGIVTRKAYDLGELELVEQSLACFYLMQGIHSSGEHPGDGLALNAMELWFKNLLVRTISLIPDDSEQACWQRDIKILNIAGKARTIRRQKAREKVTITTI